MRESIVRILSAKDAKQGLHVKTIVDRLIIEGDVLGVDVETLLKRAQALLANDVKKKSGGLFSKVRNPKTGSDHRGYYKLRSTQRVTLPSRPTEETTSSQNIADSLPVQLKDNVNLFTGKAGECAVMSELLFRGYNVNTMMVDDGVDIVASKTNLFYFIQVKTTRVDNNDRIYATIKQNRFDSFIGYQIRYIIVARCNLAKMDTNLFFVFDNKDIQKFISDGCLLNSETGISIKIKLDREKGLPVMYHNNKECDISFYMNRFEL